MLPLTSRRRSRRKLLTRRRMVYGGAILITLLVIGGLTQVSRNSGAYTAQSNRSFASRVSVLADASNVTATTADRVMSTMSTLTRSKLQVELDSVVQQTAQQESDATTLGVPAPPGVIGTDFSAAFADRAQAMVELRHAVDGLLGMHPLPVAGAAFTADSDVSTPTLLTSTEATDQIGAAGTLLSHSDAAYAAMRRGLAMAAGHARVPASSWLAHDSLWQIGAVATQVDQVVASPTLAAVPQLQLTSVRLSPSALPSPTGTLTPGTSTLTPTNRLTVSVVLGNLGTVDQPQGTVHITLTSQASDHSVSLTRVAAVAATRSVTLAPATFVVRPGTSYQLTVSVVLPADQTTTAQTELSQLLQIAPNLPPATTTTTTTPKKGSTT